MANKKEKLEKKETGVEGRGDNETLEEFSQKIYEDREGEEQGYFKQFGEISDPETEDDLEGLPEMGNWPKGEKAFDPETGLLYRKISQRYPAEGEAESDNDGEIEVQTFELPQGEQENFEKEFGNSEQQKEMLFGMKDNILIYLQQAAQEGKIEINEQQADFMVNLSREMDQQIGESDKLFKEGKIEEANKLMVDFFRRKKSEVAQYLSPEVAQKFEEYSIFLEKYLAGFLESKVSRVTGSSADLAKTLASEGADLIPYVGSLKMLTEGVAGKTAAGTQLKGFKRVLHGVGGAVFLIADVAGVVTVGGTTAASTAVKGVIFGIKGGKTGIRAINSAKLIGRSAALMKTMKVSSKVYKPVFRMAQFLRRNEKAAKVADKYLEHLAKKRDSKSFLKKVSREVGANLTDKGLREARDKNKV